MSFLSGRTSLTTVNTGDIADDAVTLPKMAAGTANYTILYDGSGNPAEAASISVEQGGTGASTHTANNVLVGNGTSAIASVAPSTSGNVLTSDGSAWTSAAVPAATTSAAGIVELSTSAENLAGTAVTSPTVAGVREMTSLVPQNIQAGNYTAVLLDQGKHIYHASDAGAQDTYTIPANASVAYPIGTALTFINMSSDTVAIAITSDTLYLATDGTTGSRTLAQYGVAVAIKMTATTWIISGSALT